MWHYSFDGKAQGPTAESSVIQLIQSGHINKDTLVWRDGMANWAALHSTELAEHLPVAQAPIYNPYQAPNSVPQVRSSAHVPLTWGQIFWSFEGRIPRRQFWAATGILYAVILAIFLIGWLIGEATDSILARVCPSSDQFRRWDAFLGDGFYFRRQSVGFCLSAEVGGSRLAVDLLFFMICGHGFPGKVVSTVPVC